MLKSISGIIYVEALAEKDGDAYTYTIESEFGTDIRKKLFYCLSERGWALIGLEALGMSLEDIFITVVDKSENRSATRHTRVTDRKRTTRKRTSIEDELADTLVSDAQKKKEEEAPLTDEE